MVGSLGDGVRYTHDNNNERGCIKHESLFCKKWPHGVDKQTREANLDPSGENPHPLLAWKHGNKNGLLLMTDQGSMRAPLGVKNTSTHDRLLLMISKEPCASLSLTEADVDITVSPQLFLQALLKLLPSA